MAKQRYTTKEIIHKLRKADVLIGQGKTVAEVCKQLGVTDKSYFRWRKSHGGLRIDQGYSNRGTVSAAADGSRRGPDLVADRGQRLRIPEEMNHVPEHSRAHRWQRHGQTWTS